MERFNKDLRGWNVVSESGFENIASRREVEWNDDFKRGILYMLKDGFGYALKNLYSGSAAETRLAELARENALHDSIFNKPMGSTRSAQKRATRGQSQNPDLQNVNLSEFGTTIHTQQRLRCGKCNEEESGEVFKRCSQCKKTYYCSKNCQVSHWPTHKTACL